MELSYIDTTRLRGSHILSRREDCKSEEVSKPAKKVPDIDTSGLRSTVNTYKADLQRKKMIICEKNSYR